MELPSALRVSSRSCRALCSSCCIQDVYPSMSVYMTAASMRLFSSIVLRWLQVPDELLQPFDGEEDDFVRRGQRKVRLKLMVPYRRDRILDGEPRGEGQHQRRLG